MKKILLFATLFALAVTSCNLDKYEPIGYSDKNVEDTGAGETATITREILQGSLNTMYNRIRNDRQEYWYQLLTLAEARADNAYGGNMGESKVVMLEANKFDSENEFPRNLWNGSMNAINDANQIICNIDIVKENDPTLTDKEYQEWLSEALCWRAYVWINMMNLFGEIPLLTELPPAINAENIEEVYPLYYPSRVSQEEVGARIIADLEDYAIHYAPDVNVSNKFKITKGFAYGLLARFYAMKQFRDWQKVITYCSAVEGLGYSLCDNYGDLWAYTEGDAGMANQNTKESIFEVSWTSKTSGSWIWMMFHRNHYNPNDSFGWAKWCTPSRNITRAYDALGDVQRKEASIIFDECGWSFHYSKENYAFMHKLPTNVTPLYIMRLADILLLRAEALANTGNPGGAADIVDRIRTRAGVATKVTAAERASAETMREVVLHERRLELAFEGHRWFDLMRFGEDYSKLKEISDGANIVGSPSYDAYNQIRRPMTDNRVLLPVPSDILDNNTNIVQNPGY